MIAFANPWAWFGAAALALPIAVHLLRRHRAARRPFPTLRFLPEARVVAIRRHRPTDVRLMAIRAAIVASAVVALAQPVWRDAAAARSTGSSLARAVVVDRSSRMARPSSDGRPAAEHAAGEVSRLRDAVNQVVVETTDLHAGIASAAGWAARQAGNREVVVVSSFPVASIEATDVAALPPGVGLRLIPIPLEAARSPTGPPLETHGDRDAAQSLTPTLTLGPAETAVAWASGPAAASAPVDWRARAEDRAALVTATAAALDVGAPVRPADRPVVVVLPGAPDWPALATGAVAIDSAWMFHVARTLANDRALTSMGRATASTAAELPVPFTPIVRGARGEVLLAGARIGPGPPQLLLMSNAAAPAPFTAALAVAIANATHDFDWSAFEPSSIPRDQLARLERPIGSPVRSAPSVEGAPLGRWLWAVALVWLVVEWWWRRRPEPAAAATATGDRRVA